MSKVGAKLRRQVARDANGCCEYCKSQECFAMQTFSLDHIIPRSRRGETIEGNLAWVCQGCNNHKYNKASTRDPLSGEIVGLFHPRQQRWTEHFAWNEDATLILGLSRVGRATVEALQLNRVGLVNLRRILSAVGEHPP
jgi:HNH endonuclease